jgi:hypothetical protein
MPNKVRPAGGDGEPRQEIEKEASQPNNQSTEPTQEPRSSGECLPFHPLAEMFPLLEGAEFEKFVGDIQRRGLHFPITIYDGKIIDGRNRARACQKAGVEPRYVQFEGNAEDIPRFILSANIHRRHLTPEQRRGVIKQLLKMNPEQSDRAIASDIRTDHKTVGAIRKQQEATGEIPQLKARTGKDGKTRKSLSAQPRKPPKRRGHKKVVEPTPKEQAAPDVIAPDEELTLLREFARFVIDRARVSTDPKDQNEWKVLLARVKQCFRHCTRRMAPAKCPASPRSCGGPRHDDPRQWRRPRDCI